MQTLDTVYPKDLMVIQLFTDIIYYSIFPHYWSYTVDLQF